MEGSLAAQAPGMGGTESAALAATRESIAVPRLARSRIVGVHSLGGLKFLSSGSKLLSQPHRHANRPLVFLLEKQCLFLGCFKFLPHRGDRMS
jgi:hypothetical protein